MKPPRALPAQPGFTLIELLVVIAIIGLLASIVLASLQTAKTKGNDAAVQSEMKAVRNAAEIYFTQNGNYGITGATGVSDCGLALSMWQSSAGNMSNVFNALSTAVGGTGNVDCGTTGTGSGSGNQEWSVAALLPSGAVFCIDSRGWAGTTVKDGASAGQQYVAIVGGTGNGNKAHATAGDTFCN